VIPEISPPGDARPAFEYDLDLLRETCDKTFIPGTGEYLFPPGRVTLFNKVGALDADYQVIVHGVSYGNLRYDIFRQQHVFAPTMAGGKVIYKFYVETGLIDGQDPKQLCPPKCIKYKTEAEQFISDGMSIVVPGVEKMDINIELNDPCIVYSDHGFLATGHYTADHDEIIAFVTEGKGRLAKSREHGPPVPSDEIARPDSYPAVTLDDVISANEPIVREMEAEAIHFIQKTARNYALPIAVAYSGGKDSLATLLLVKKALNSGESPFPFTLFFADTGLEFPEILQNVKDVVSWANMDEDAFIIRSIGEKFWDLAGNFGPPARDFRFCCHTLKASQINDIIEEIAAKSGNPGSKVLVFLGERRYESFTRAEDRRVYVNTYVPNQVAAAPIREWTAFDEWMFLLGEHRADPSVPITPLYFKGHDRLGCFLCPAQSMASFERVRETHPDLFTRWMAVLEDYRDAWGYPAEWLTWGLWRFKHPRGQWAEITKQLPGPTGKLVENPEGAMAPEDVKLFITKGVSPCVAGGFSVKARFSIPLDVAELLQWVRVLDRRVEHDEDAGLLFIDKPDLKFMLYADGSVFLQSIDPDFDFDRFVKFLLGAVARGVACQRCGVCASVCPDGAITQDPETGRVSIDASLCRGITCQNCVLHCPVFHASRGNIFNEDGVISDEFTSEEAPLEDMIAEEPIPEEKAKRKRKPLKRKPLKRATKRKPRRGSHEEEAIEESITEEETIGEGAIEEEVTEEGIPEENDTEELIPEEEATEEGIPEERVTEESTPEEESTENDISGEDIIE
jgi:phosphoadenosine phosphosulfate reductase